jgi:hypothetical protein
MSALRREQEPQSLDARIRNAEQRIATRRLVLAARASDVNGKVRRKLGSPLLILAAAGAGFVFAQFKRRRGSGERDRDDKPEVVMKPSIFAVLTDALTLATTVLAMLPLIRSKAKDAAKEGVQEAAVEGAVEVTPP